MKAVRCPKTPQWNFRTPEGRDCNNPSNIGSRYSGSLASVTPEKLLQERDGILAWAVHGCLGWQRQGLNPPRCVQQATEAYLEAEDAHGRWLEERCEFGKAYEMASAPLYADWKPWAEERGEYVGSLKRFSEVLIARGFTPCRIGRSQARGFRGLRLAQMTPAESYARASDRGGY